jgi:hypothetical protein
MIKRNKLWMSISALTLVGATSAGISGCDSQTQNNQGAKQQIEQSLNGTQNSAPAVAASATKIASPEGEGEGADGGVNLATDDIAYLTQLALMRGHLFVGNELYKAGHIEHAKMHMKHPQSELYADVAPAFDARGSNGFAAELSTLADAVEGEMSAEIVAPAYTSLVLLIAANEAAISADTLAPDQVLKLVSEVLRVAGEEYAIAVVDGEMQNAHEYQDALGFTTIATSIVTAISSNDGNVNSAKNAALTLLQQLQSHWPSLIPPATLDTKADAIYVAAAKIELLSLGLK